MPAWLIVQVAKPPGVVVLVWQVSHAAVVEICCAGLPSTTVFLDPTDDPLWQLAHPVEIPAWLIVQFAKPPGVEVSVWQDSHAAAVKMWFDGLPSTTVLLEPKATPLWQLAQPVEMPV